MKEPVALASEREQASHGQGRYAMTSGEQAAKLDESVDDQGRQVVTIDQMSREAEGGRKEKRLGHGRWGAFRREVGVGREWR